MSKKSYSPMASYADLKEVEVLIGKAKTIDELREVAAKNGPKVGWKAFSYIFTGKMTPEEMKPDEAPTNGKK